MANKKECGIQCRNGTPLPDTSDDSYSPEDISLIERLYDSFNTTLDLRIFVTIIVLGVLGVAVDPKLTNKLELQVGMAVSASIIAYLAKIGKP